jgi:hypothetical protein
MSGAADALKVPTIAVRVELLLHGGPPVMRAVELFVAEHLADQYRRQHVTDLLEAAAAFVPVRSAGEGVVELLNKEAVIWVRVPLHAGEPPVEEKLDPASADVELFDEMHAVRVELASAEPLGGDILYSPTAAGHGRVVDYLNEPGRMFRLWTAEHLYLINKRFVVRVVERRS